MPIGMPLVKHLKNGLWEIRSNISDNKIARVIFFTLSNKIILVDGFIKKTQNIPKQNLELSLERKNKFQLMEKNYGK